MNPQEELDLLNNLIDELLAGLQDIIQSGEILSDEFQGAIAQELEQTTSRIDQLRQEIGQQPPEMPIEQPASDGSKLLWILSGGDENAFVNYLRTYPGDDFQQLLSNPNQLASVINDLQQNNPIQPTQEPGSDGIPGTMYQSSNVAGMKYDPKSKKLLVKFHGKNGEPVYQYEGVPPQIFKLIQHGNAFAKTSGQNQWGKWWRFKVPSIGASINEYLKKGGYAYNRIR